MDNKAPLHSRGNTNDAAMSVRNDNQIILRRGAVSNDNDGTPLLINDRGEAFRVNDTAISLWNMCNGITFDELFMEVRRISSGSESEVRSSLDEMIKQFYSIAVVELKDMQRANPVRKSGMRR